MFPRWFVELARREAADAGVPPERVVLGGFSQGGAMALRASQKGSYGRSRGAVLSKIHGAA